VVERALAMIALTVALDGCSGSSSHDAAPGLAANDAGSAAAVLAGPPRWLGVVGDRLAPLPPPSSGRSDRFATSDACAQCHLASNGTALRDASGRDISPVGTWRTSAMALAARDPYYLAAVADELARRPNIEADVQAICTRCHAPAAAVELEPGTATPTFAMLTTATDTSAAASFARDGVTCSLCHQIQPDDLGTRASFSGGFTVGSERQIFGPYPNPTTDPMRTFVNYTPTYGAHIEKSALCATCHTVITRARDSRGYVGPEFPEQVPYLEWLASSYANEGRLGTKAAACQDCHMPAADASGATIETPIAVFPTGLAKRRPFWRHGFAGGNGFLSRLAASDPAWIGVPLQRADHEAQADATEATVRTAATLAVGGVKRTGDGIEVAVIVTNQTGHKFPTGYPSRRAWLHVKVTSATGDVLFESGRFDAYGRLVGRGDGHGDVLLEPATFAPHLDVVDREEQVQIYESVPIDAAGNVARRPLDAVRYGKDNRLLPDGFDRKNAWAAFTAPIGTDRDAAFGSTDTVTYRIARVPAGATIEAGLLFQVARPTDLEALADQPTPAARKLFDMTTAAPPLPVVVATARGTAP
jgi:hypothetical protein